MFLFLSTERISSYSSRLQHLLEHFSDLLCSVWKLFFPRKKHFKLSCFTSLVSFEEETKYKFQTDMTCSCQGIASCFQKHSSLLNDCGQTVPCISSYSLSVQSPYCNILHLLLPSYQATESNFMVNAFSSSATSLVKDYNTSAANSLLIKCLIVVL